MLTLADLADLYAAHRSSFEMEVAEFSVGSKFLHFNTKPAIMGVINLSTDSWYRESVCSQTESAVRRGEILLAQGADIIDLGAESTLPNASSIEVRKQWQRLSPVVESIVSSGGSVSLETYHADLASNALEAGVASINMTGNGDSQSIYEACAAHNAAVIICFVQGKHVRAVDQLELEGDPVEAMMHWFEMEVEKAQSAGVNKVIIDPGLGFYYRNLADGVKRVRYQMNMFLNTFRLRKLGWPVCHALPHAFEFFGEEVRTAEPFFSVLATLGKTDLLRTHEVSKVRAVLETMSQFNEK